MSVKERHFVVTGATGWIGRRVCSVLKEQGSEVIAVDLSKKDGPWDHFIEQDISSSPSIREEVLEQDAYTLIHCAGYAHRPNETEAEVEKFYKINAEGTKNVVNWAKEMGIKKFVYLSSIAFYDWNNVAELPLNEDAPVKGETAYAKSKLVGEEAVRNSGLDYRIVRLATVFGNGDRANFSKLASAIKNKRFVLPGGGNARKSVISVDAAAEYICRYALMEEPQYRLINLGFPKAPTLKEICDTFSKECDFPKVRSVPEWILIAGGRFGDALQKLGLSIPLTSSTLNKLTTDTRVDCSKASEMFPDLAKLSFEESLEQSSVYYKNL